MSAKDSEVLQRLADRAEGQIQWCQDQPSRERQRETHAALTRAAALARAIEEGRWKVVPVEPTGDMTRAADAEDDKAYCGGSQHGATVEDHWNAMIAAATTFDPKPQEGV